MEKENKLIKLAVLFYICSIIGYIYELILTYVFEGKVFSHGILNGPWLPIYGAGAILIAFLNKYKKHPLKIFIYSFFLTGFLEGLSGFILLKFFKMRLWDYTGRFLNINGFVCFLSAFCFGIGGLLITYLLIPLIDKLLSKIKKKYVLIILGILSLLFSIDIITVIFK